MNSSSRDVLRGQSPVRWGVGLVVAVACLIAVSVPSSTLGNFYLHLDELSYHVRSRDVAAARAELEEVTAFYDRSRRLGMQWFADSYLFSDSFLHRASFSYLTGDYENVVVDLQDRIDDHRASYLLGVAKFRLAQLRYRAIEGGGAPTISARAEIVNEVLEEVNPDFERALRGDPGEQFDYKWNYDLTSDPEAVRRALERLEPTEPLEDELLKGEGTPARGRRG